MTDTEDSALAWMRRTAEALGIYSQGDTLLEMAGALTGWISDRANHPGMKKMRADLAESDRINGEMLRELGTLRASAARREQWLSSAKRAAGYHDNVSFDIVWADALRALIANQPMSSELVECVNHLKGKWPEDVTSGRMFWRGELIYQERFVDAARRLGFSS
jgi:hypothetical protein